MTTHPSFAPLRFVILLAWVLLACGCSPPAVSVHADDAAAPECRPDAGPVELTGEVTEADARSYRMLPFRVAAGTGRIEVGYGWAPLSGPIDDPLLQTVFDLGLWDANGYREARGFRGWSGSRQGRLDLGQAPVFIEYARAERGYHPGPIEPGIWSVDLGIAAVSPGGARFHVRIECSTGDGEPTTDDPVDPMHVARPEPGWYHGDFHMHGWHSNPVAPSWDDMIDEARGAGLDFLMLTEYVTGQHWRTLGAVQRAHPDVVIWPGREVITYFGHATVFGETPNTLEYRHGFEDVRMREIQAGSKDDGALFGIAHPTIYPGDEFRRFCRGCEYELDDDTDFSRVDTVEVLTGPIIVDSRMLQLPGPPRPVQNPFVQTAIEYWEDKLRRGYRITAVSGSDAKGVEDAQTRRVRGYGSSATAIYSDALSRPALRAAIEAGRAYVKTRGAHDSPNLQMHAHTADGHTFSWGDTVPADRAQLEIRVVGGAGQTLEVIRNGEIVATETIDGDDFSYSLDIVGAADAGPLGTFWRIQTRDAVALTTIGNPLYLRAAE
jgi:hypothetical protein